MGRLNQQFFFFICKIYNRQIIHVELQLDRILLSFINVTILREIRNSSSTIACAQISRANRSISPGISLQSLIGSLIIQLFTRKLKQFSIKIRRADIINAVYSLFKVLFEK
jgi:hypothetical protein